MATTTPPITQPPQDAPAGTVEEPVATSTPEIIPGIPSPSQREGAGDEVVPAPVIEPVVPSEPIT